MRKGNSEKINKGDLLRISPENGDVVVVKVTDEEDLSGNPVLSFSRRIAKILNLTTQALDKLEVVKDLGEIKLDFVDVLIHEDFVTREDMVRIQNLLLNTIVYTGCSHHRLEIRHSLGDLLRSSVKVKSGLVTPETIILFKSLNSSILVLIQISSETFDYADHKYTLSERMIEVFFSRFFERFKELSHHKVCLVYFARMKKDYLNYKDFYMQLMPVFKIDELIEGSICQTMRERLIEFHQLLIESSPPSWDLTSSSEGNILESMNFGCDVLENWLAYPEFDRSCVELIVITPCTGVFPVDPALHSLTMNRFIHAQFRCIMLSLGSPPAHAVPIFYDRNKPVDLSSSVVGQFWVPVWFHLVFCRSTPKSDETTFIPHLKINFTTKTVSLKPLNFPAGIEEEVVEETEIVPATPEYKSEKMEEQSILKRGVLKRFMNLSKRSILPQKDHILFVNPFIREEVLSSVNKHRYLRSFDHMSLHPSEQKGVGILSDFSIICDDDDEYTWDWLTKVALLPLLRDFSPRDVVMQGDYKVYIASHPLHISDKPMHTNYANLMKQLVYQRISLGYQVLRNRLGEYVEPERKLEEQKEGDLGVELCKGLQIQILSVSEMKESIEVQQISGSEVGTEKFDFTLTEGDKSEFVDKTAIVKYSTAGNLTMLDQLAMGLVDTDSVGLPWKRIGFVIIPNKENGKESRGNASSIIVEASGAATTPITTDFLDNFTGKVNQLLKAALGRFGKANPPVVQSSRDWNTSSSMREVKLERDFSSSDLYYEWLRIRYSSGTRHFQTFKIEISWLCGSSVFIKEVVSALTRNASSLDLAMVWCPLELGYFEDNPLIYQRRCIDVGRIPSPIHKTLNERMGILLHINQNCFIDQNGTVLLINRDGNLYLTGNPFSYDRGSVTALLEDIKSVFGGE